MTELTEAGHPRAGQAALDTTEVRPDPVHGCRAAVDGEGGAPVLRMTPYAGANWAEIKSVGKNPVAFLRRNNVPVFIRIDRKNTVALQYYALQQPLEGITAMRLTESPMYLRLDNDVLSELSISRASKCAEFTAGGLVLIGEKTEVDPNLAEIDFQRCYILASSVLTELQDECARGGMTASGYFKKAEDLFFTEEDLWLSTADLAAIRAGDNSAGEVMDYPYDHRAQVPAVYWMFQAAYILNALRTKSEEEIALWLREKGGKSLFSVKRTELAVKLVKPTVNRAQGRNSLAKPFKMHDLDNWTYADKFTFPFVSEGMTIILAVTDWWVTIRASSPDEPRLTLGKKLAEENFNTTEAGYLVCLITGNNLASEELEVLASYEQEIEAGVQRSSQSTELGAGLPASRGGSIPDSEADGSADTQ